MEIPVTAVRELVDYQSCIRIARIFVPRRIGAVFVVGKYFARLQSEDNDIVVADCLAYFDVRAVKGSEVLCRNQ